MKKILLPTICIFFAFLLKAQEPQEINLTTNTEKKIYFGVGFGIGFFYPDDVNDYIKDQTDNLLMTYGFSDLLVNYSLKATLCFKMSENIDLTVIGEYSLGPKIILIDNGDNMNFSFNKFSSGIVPKFYFPMGNGRNSIFIAPGLLYNFMKFEEYAAAGLGAKLEGGFSFRLGQTRMQPFAAFEYAKATDDATGYDEFKLNYTRFQIGMDFLF